MRQGPLRCDKCLRLAIGLIAATSLLVACNQPAFSWLRPAPEPANEQNSQTENSTEPTLETADTGFTLTPKPQPTNETAAKPVATRNLKVAVVHIQVPTRRAKDADKIWTHLREDLIDAETLVRLERNGFRVGAGNIQWWDAIRQTLDGIEGVRVIVATPIEVPIGFPVAMELDMAPRDQTLFCVGMDGVLSGGSWPASRNVLRVLYGIDPKSPERIRMQVAPEIHQSMEGWEWTRTEEGVWQTPKRKRSEVGSAAFSISLGHDEFVAMSPSASANVTGLIGSAFLTAELEGVEYRSYVFLRPDAGDIGGEPKAP